MLVEVKIQRTSAIIRAKCLQSAIVLEIVKILGSHYNACKSACSVAVRPVLADVRYRPLPSVADAYMV